MLCALILGHLLFAPFVAADDASVAAPDRRVLPAPIPSPPFPNGDWVGDTVGWRDPMPASPLDDFIPRDTHQIIGMRFYGWAELGANLSTSSRSNTPMAYAIVPNTVALQQAVVVVERVPDTVQIDHVDWGFRVTNLYGVDYRYTTAKGWFSDQLLKHNQLYGWDPVELFAQLYFPSIGEGMTVKFGRYFSFTDVESPLAPDSYTYTHSISLTYSPYTFTGLQASFRLHERWMLAVGLHAGNDMAPWSDSAQLNGELLLRWVSEDNNEAFSGGLNSVGTGQFKNGHDNLQMAIATWGHRFNDRLHMMTEAYYTWQHNAALGGSCINGPSQRFDIAVGCGPIIAGLSSNIGVVNYFQIMTTPGSYISLSNEMLADMQGQRTGFATTYTSHTAAFIYQFDDWVEARPGVRYERGWTHGATPYDNGTKRDQLTLSGDIIVRL